MEKFEHLLAKSEKYGSLTLYDHLDQVRMVAEEVAVNIGLDKNLARRGALLHDIGKAHPLFQKRLQGEEEKPSFGILNVFNTEESLPLRHELSSLCFLSLFPQEEWAALIDMVVGHHKSVKEDRNRRGLLDLIEEYPANEILGHHVGDWDTWSKDAMGLLALFGIRGNSVSSEEALSNLYYVAEYCQSKPSAWSQWRGLLMAADHFGSALADRTAVRVGALFSKPDLAAFYRPHELYVLSEMSVADPRPHTLVTAPTGSGKTDFLMRRCRSRIFYTLPFQASINAMYARFRKMFPAGTDVRLQHASSRIVVKRGNQTEEEGALQTLVGASVKVLTPHQIASLIFGTKGFETVAVDVMGNDVVLDEIHTYTKHTLSLVVEVVRVLLKLGCRIHIGTATMPSVLYQQLLELLGGDESVYQVRLDDPELNSYNRHIVHKEESLESAFGAIDTAVEQDEKLLIVMNRVDRAQKLFEQLTQTYPDIPKMLIHSRFRRGDRAKLEDRLVSEFNEMGQVCIVVATQVVEVSLDVSFDRMVTECSPLDSLVQRFGRVNRIRTNKTIGKYKPVHVIAPPEEVKEALPYDLDVLRKSFDQLPDGEILEEAKLQSRLDQVYSTIEVPDIWMHTVWDGDKFQQKELCHRAGSILADTLNIDSVTCILEQDREAYVKSSYDERAAFEISISWKSTYRKELKPYFIKENQLERLGSWPFVLPDELYSSEQGLVFRSIDNIVG